MIIASILQINHISHFFFLYLHSFYTRKITKDRKIRAFNKNKLTLC